METNEKKTSVFENGMIWFGAAVSIAEIMAGTSFASLGFAKGLLAIVIGHIIGCALLYFAGLIGAKTGKSAMDTVKASFGNRGSVLFSALNIIQLLGWTAVMISGGASAAGGIALAGQQWIWCLAIGALIMLWLIIGIKNLGKINIVAMSALFILTVVLSVIVFKNGSGHAVAGGGISFGMAIELSVAMPLSWLPLISDYTKTAKKPLPATLASSGVYFLASCWMYIIGMAAALFTGKTEISEIMLFAGLGAAGLVIIIVSTVTTTFLDVYSAGESGVSIIKRLNPKLVAAAVCVIGTAAAIFLPITEQFENFLYFIGSVFAPMTAVMITDAFILKRSFSDRGFAPANLIIWLIGFILYRIFMKFDIITGCTIPIMLITGVITFAVGKISQRISKNS